MALQLEMMVQLILPIDMMVRLILQLRKMCQENQIQWMKNLMVLLNYMKALFVLKNMMDLMDLLILLTVQLVLQHYKMVLLDQMR